MKSPPLHQTMNALNDEDRDISNRVHAFVMRMMADNVKCIFVTGPYCCVEDDGKSAKMNGFLGGKILQCNLQTAVAIRTLHPNPGPVSREVSWICNKNHIGTKMMQSFVFMIEIVHEMDAVDHCANREIRSSALYTSIQAVSKLMYELNKIIGAGVVLGVCVAILNMNSMPNTTLLELPHQETRILLPLHRAYSTLPQELVLTGTRIPDAYLDMGMDVRARSKYFAERAVASPFVSILIGPRLFPHKVLETKVLKPRSTPHIAVVIIKYREEE